MSTGMYRCYHCALDATEHDGNYNCPDCSPQFKGSLIEICDSCDRELDDCVCNDEDDEK